jgi:cysteine desulfurase
MPPEAEIYLDNNATTPALPEVVRTVTEALMEGFGNPSSAHARGDLARCQLQRARETVAGFLGAEPEQLVFVSSGTEGNNAVLGGVRVSTLITTAVEHPSVLSPIAAAAGRGAAVVELGVDCSGLIALSALEAALRAASRVLVSVQWASGETGVVQPIEEIAAICRRHGALLHVDAAQAVGRLPIDLRRISINFLTFSGHKLHAPPGIGVLFVRAPGAMAPWLLGGGQEQGLRSGTENLPGVLGLAAAIEHRASRFAEALRSMRQLRDALEREVLASVPDVKVNGGGAPRLGNTSNLRFAGVEGQALLAALDRAAIRCSQASACSSRRPEPSYVLRAMGLSGDEAFASLRFSVSILNTADEMDRAVKTIQAAVARLRSVVLV